MYDAGKIVPGLLIFLLALTFPIWYNLPSASSASPPQLQLPADEKQCVESADYMRTSHMDLLNRWRDEAVRQGDRTYVSSDGRTFEKSLTKTCLRCHSPKEQFCDRCHSYNSVTPNCYSCHLKPEAK